MQSYQEQIVSRQNQPFQIQPAFPVRSCLSRQSQTSRYSQPFYVQSPFQVCATSPSCQYRKPLQAYPIQPFWVLKSHLFKIQLSFAVFYKQSQFLVFVEQPAFAAGQPFGGRKVLQRRALYVELALACWLGQPFKKKPTFPGRTILSYFNRLSVLPMEIPKQNFQNFEPGYSL